MVLVILLKSTLKTYRNKYFKKTLIQKNDLKKHRLWTMESPVTVNWHLCTKALQRKTDNSASTQLVGLPSRLIFRVHFVYFFKSRQSCTWTCRKAERSNIAESRGISNRHESSWRLFFGIFTNVYVAQAMP